MDSVFRQMDEWFQTTLGQELLTAERRALEPWFSESKGDLLLQIGGPNEFPLLPQSKFITFCRLSPELKPHFQGHCISADWHELPFLPNTIDGIVLAHVVELAKDPMAVLLEIQRVLVAEGYVFILSFNPFSWWGLKKLLTSSRRGPWSGRYPMAWQMRHWLNKAGLKVVEHKTVFFRPPCQSVSCLRVLRWLEPLGQLLWSYLGAVNVIVAKKSVVQLIPSKERKIRRVTVSDRYLEPVAKFTGEFAGRLETATRNVDISWKS